MKSNYKNEKSENLRSNSNSRETMESDLGQEETEESMVGTICGKVGFKPGVKKRVVWMRFV